ncbi:HNH endonuclease [Agromyces sp. Soil535]|uniref:HNH endonuclease n=1 Tax=Agromyces sp. Soil535 TaxID=1736390 RepID=UPI0006FB8AE1|nr:HNH endonuclease [Agromyces sp. Soil535]KRE21880.1 hypothetical protein ASG80_12440 [Agromyces sp. Soil535]
MFRWLDAQLGAGKWEFSRDELLSYEFEGRRVPLIDHGGRGIKNPATFRSTLSVIAGGEGGYDDEVLEGGLIRYSYRRGDGGDNTKLSNALLTQAPLVYFQKVRPSFYVATYPARVVRDVPEERHVIIAPGDIFEFFDDPLSMPYDARKYAEKLTRIRLHQPLFRARVLDAYNATCAICKLKHAVLLDAAHIIGDAEDGGVADVSNGLALCKIHHASYDRNLLGITPDYEVRIDQGLLDEIDGPMLRHGLQDMHGRRLALPDHRADWPDPERLAIRYDVFAA